MSSTKSIAWQYFTLQEDKQTVKCRICENTLKHTGGSTSSMFKHINGVHRNDPLPQSKEKQALMSAFLKPAKRILPDETIANNITNMIGRRLHTYFNSGRKRISEIDSQSSSKL